jgi:hypothetical protein
MMVLGALVLLWITHKIVGVMAWVGRMTFKTIVYGAVWALLIALVWSLLTSGTTTTTTKKPMEAPQMPGNDPKQPIHGGSTDEVGQGLVTVVGVLQHLWQGEIPRMTPTWLLGGGARMAYRGVTASARYLVGGLLWDRFAPSLQTLGRRVMATASQAGQGRSPPSQSLPHRNPACDIPCSVSGTDCPNDAPCLCSWAKTQTGRGTGEGYSTVWRPCRHLHTWKKMGRCMCDRAPGHTSPPQQ